jgi:hypothetical protein
MRKPRYMLTKESYEDHFIIKDERYVVCRKSAGMLSQTCLDPDKLAENDQGSRKNRGRLCVSLST